MCIHVLNPGSTMFSHLAAIVRATSRLKLDLPKFSGDMLDWRQFWSLFSVRIEREIGLTDPEKVSCLEEAMQDAAAKNIVRP